jgi:hypothetical protein
MFSSTDRSQYNQPCEPYPSWKYQIEANQIMETQLAFVVGEK